MRKDDNIWNDVSSDDEFTKEINSQRERNIQCSSFTVGNKENIPPGGLLSTVTRVSYENCGILNDRNKQNRITNSFLSDADADSDFETSNPSCTANTVAVAGEEKQTCTDTDGQINLLPYLKQTFKSFQKGLNFANRYAADAGFCWTRTTKLENRGPNKKYTLRKIVCHRYGKKEVKKSLKLKGIRKLSASIKCGCGVFINFMEHQDTGKTYIAKMNLAHTWPCSPGGKQLIIGRRKGGKMPQSIPLECVQDIADMMHAKLRAQSVHKLLLKKKSFPKSIIIGAEFLRNMRLFVQRHKVKPNMPISQLRKTLSLTDHEMDSVDYEEVVVAAIMELSSAAEAARSATEANLDQLLPFLNFIQKKDKLFAFKVMYLPGTNKISAVFLMTGY